MKLEIPFPDNKINWFMKKIGISPDDFKKIEKHSHLFINNGPEFSSFFFDYFRRIDETGFLLAHLEHKDALRNIWSKWFVSFFTSSFDYHFLLTLWRSGLRHVELSIDHRYIALSYSVLRQFCQKIVKAEMPANDQKTILIIIDKMTDFCLLIETHAFIEATSRCDMEVVRGISHQVRNPLTVISGHAMRLMNNAKKDASQKDIAMVCKTIIEESKRLEKMVTDAAIYSDMYEKESEHSGISLNSILSDGTERFMNRMNITSNLSQDDLMIHGNRNDLEMLFVNIFQNCIETAGEKKPDIQLSAAHGDSSAPFIEVEIINRGFYVKPEDIQNAFVPFYSSKPDGTGFGLSIARLAARKNLGDMHIESLPQQGMRYLIKLPALVKENKE